MNKMKLDELNGYEKAKLKQEVLLEHFSATILISMVTATVVYLILHSVALN